ncbi:MAG: NTP transferase domain-containing protein, partial [Candidatus Desulfovibrio faecigallinarum]|nr:NTP transferase domain-containing protein [Candidatus Desulfovibrio faecigallinarum]
MSTVAIIQARVGSSRLPMKSLLCLRGHALIDWVVNRVSEAARLDGVVVAMPDTERDNVLQAHLDDWGVAVVRGSEQDVLSRFLLAARETHADRIVRICADNPFVWGEAIDRLVDFYNASNLDYAYNHIPRNNLWPDGLGAEILSRDLLEDIGKKADQPSQREHCLNYIWDNRDRFSIGTFDPEEGWLKRPEVKLDIDTADDFCRLAL